jgi:hypothetical protein
MTLPSDRAQSIDRRWSRRAWIGAVVLVPLADVACAMPTDLSRVAPEGAAPLTERGPWDLAVNEAIAGVSGVLARAHGPLQFERWQLPAMMDLASAQAQVATELGKEWARLEGLPEHVSGARLCAWQRPVLVGRAPSFALALLDAPIRLASGAQVHLAITALPRTA